MIDATCPLVTKVHLEAVRFARDGYSIVLIGHKDHDEVIGTLGEVPGRSHLVETLEDVDRLELPDSTRVRYLTQTTLSLDETRDLIGRLKERFPTCCWWSARKTVRTRSGWWRWATISECARTW